MPCSPDCELLRADGSRDVESCADSGCDAIRHEPGICPACGSDELDFDGFLVEDNSVIYKWDCKGCGIGGRECYDMTFSEHIIDGGDGS
jgi:hypothetical protein